MFFFLMITKKPLTHFLKDVELFLYYAGSMDLSILKLLKYWVSLSKP